MTLPRRQQRLLRRASRALRRSDPDLESMLSIFARLGAAEALPAREQLPPQPAWARRVLRWPVSAVTFAAFRRGRPRSARGKTLTRERE